jgi:hypothetical protein
MCDQMLRKSQNVMVLARFIFFSVDEATTIDKEVIDFN